MPRSRISCLIAARVTTRVPTLTLAVVTGTHTFSLFQAVQLQKP
jgi:hypothetical protein